MAYCCQCADHYWLYVVVDCATNPKLYRVQDPAFKLAVKTRQSSPSTSATSSERQSKTEGRALKANAKSSKFPLKREAINLLPLEKGGWEDSRAIFQTAKLIQSSKLRRNYAKKPSRLKKVYPTILRKFVLSSKCPPSRSGYSQFGSGQPLLEHRADHHAGHSKNEKRAGYGSNSSKNWLGNLGRNTDRATQPRTFGI